MHKVIKQKASSYNIQMIISVRKEQTTPTERTETSIKQRERRKSLERGSWYRKEKANNTSRMSQENYRRGDNILQ